MCYFSLLFELLRPQILPDTSRAQNVSFSYPLWKSEYFTLIFRTSYFENPNFAPRHREGSKELPERWTWREPSVWTIRNFLIVAPTPTPSLREAPAQQRTESRNACIPDRSEAVVESERSKRIGATKQSPIISPQKYVSSIFLLPST